jgi:hypothetical protein
MAMQKKNNSLSHRKLFKKEHRLAIKYGKNAHRGIAKNSDLD